VRSSYEKEERGAGRTSSHFKIEEKKSSDERARGEISVRRTHREQDPKGEAKRRGEEGERCILNLLSKEEDLP